MSVVGNAIKKIVSESDALLPLVSPIWPKIIPPKGLAIKPDAKTPKVASNDNVGFFDGK